MKIKHVFIISVLFLTLLVSFIPRAIADDGYEENDTFAEAKPITPGTYTNLNCSDEDYFSVVVPTDSTIVANITFDNVISDLDLYLYDDLENQLDYSESVDFFEEVSYYSADGGTYIINVYPYDEPPTRKFYNLTIVIYDGEVSIGDTIELTNPTLYSNWQQGMDMTISWMSSGTIPNVVIYLYKDVNESPSLGAIISTGTANTGSYVWTIPDSIVDDDDYGIYIADSADMDPYDFIGPFSISSTAETPSIIVEAPNFTSIWNNGSQYDITWTTTGSVSMVNLILYNDGGPVNVIDSVISNTGSYQWTVPDLSSGSDYYVNVSDAMNANLWGISDDFAINNTYNPIELIIISNPVESSTLYKCKTYEISWIWSGIFSHVNISLWNSEGIISNISLNAENNGSYYWTIPCNATSGTDYYLVISDNSDSSPTCTSCTFSIQDEPEDNKEENGDEDEDDEPIPGIPGIPLVEMFSVLTVAVLIGFILMHRKLK